MWSSGETEVLSILVVVYTLAGRSKGEINTLIRRMFRTGESRFDGFQLIPKYLVYNNIYLLQLGYHPVAVLTLHVSKHENG